MSSTPDRKTPSLEHILGHAIFTAAQIILSSRIPSSLTPACRTTINKSSSHWFNLEFDELTEASPTLDSWKTDPSRPLVLEIFHQPLEATISPSSPSPTETLLERWHISHSPSLPTVITGPSSSSSSSSSRSSMSRLNPAGVYKRLVILLRSLTSYSRILPAYKLYRSCKDSLNMSSSSSISSAGYTLGYRVLSNNNNSNSSSVVDGDSAISASFSTITTHSFTFTPVDSATGKFHIHVQYSQSVPSKEASSRATTGPTLVLPNYIRTSLPTNSTTTAPLPVNQHSSSQGYSASYGTSPGSTAYRRSSWSNSFRLPSATTTTNTTRRRSDDSSSSGIITRPMMIPGTTPSPSQQLPLPPIITTNTTTPPSRHHQKTVQYMHLSPSPQPSAGGGGGGRDASTPQSPNLPFAMTPSGGGGGSTMMMMMMRSSSSSLSSSSYDRSRENSMLVRNHYQQQQHGGGGSSCSLSPSPSGENVSASSEGGDGGGGGGGVSLPRQVSSSTALTIRRQQQSMPMMGYSISPMPDVMSLSRGESSSLPRMMMDSTSLRSYSTGSTTGRRASGNIQLLTYRNTSDGGTKISSSSGEGGGGGGNVHHHQYGKEPSSGDHNQTSFPFDQYDKRVAVMGKDDEKKNGGGGDDDDVAISSFMGIMQAAPRLRDDDDGRGGGKTVEDGLRWLERYVQ